jgi:hypothetical protein
MTNASVTLAETGIANPANVIFLVGGEKLVPTLAPAHAVCCCRKIKRARFQGRNQALIAWS